ncbi:unnamed protein product [Linum tenue]|uniref:Derlin n=1 Tax=Linum tenue TaxID=586396 RepID=A0AAV0MVH4_9ROSI|nr:unnamed protein product [Linum tenue]
MSTPGEYYRSLPPVSKTYGVACLMTTAAFYLDLYNPESIALFYDNVFKRFQIWRLITNFFFLGPFSFPFAFRLIIIAKYGVSLERGPFDQRTADFVWMFFFGALSLLVSDAVPALWSPFMGVSLVFMIVYIWGREFPNARISIYGLVSLKAQIGGVLGRREAAEFSISERPIGGSCFPGKKLPSQWRRRTTTNATGERWFTSSNNWGAAAGECRRGSSFPREKLSP